MTTTLAHRVEQTCRALTTDGTPISFPAIAERSGISRSTLYRHPELRALVEEHRQQQREALTLSGLAVQIDQLRHTLEALATKVRRHEEELRALRRRDDKAAG
jgi:AcrR family transcriptional regulator